MSFGWDEIQDILKKASYALCFGLQESGKFIVPKHCDTRCPLVCNLMYAHSARIYTYGVGYGVAVWNERQYQSLGMRNSKIAVPLFLCMSVDNFRSLNV